MTSSATPGRPRLARLGAAKSVVVMVTDAAW
jgi:hypothetical protein